MKNLLCILMVCCLGATAQSRSFTVSGFDKLSLGSAFNITVKKGAFGVQATGRTEDINDLDARVENGILKVTYKNGKGWSWTKNRKDVHLNITMPALHGVELSGATESTISGFVSKVFNVSVSGASNSQISVSADKISVNCSGASDLKLSGDADYMVADVSGASELKAMDCKVKNAKISSSGASDAKVFVSESLVASASGASDIRYRGTKNVKKSTSGSSSVQND